MRDEAQVELLESFRAAYQAEYSAFPLDRGGEPSDFWIRNGSFESVDAEILYSMIRHFRPLRMIEVGAGESTILAAKALSRNADEGYRCEFVSIDPYPPTKIREGMTGLTSLVASPVQDVPADTFVQLRANDILFIDSTHVLRIGSDVQYELLEIVPSLQRGVIVHFHDIFMPAEYPRKWVMDDKRFWSEQYLLQAFLAFNGSFEVLWGSSYMHLVHPELLEKAFGSYERNLWWPASFWIRRI